MSALKALFSAFATLSLFIRHTNGVTPSFIHRCNSTDSACLTKATQDAIPEFVKGIPEYGIPTLDPFIVNDLKLTLPGGLEFSFHNGKSSGLRNCNVNKVSMKLGEYQQLDMNCNLSMKGKYKSKGRILLFAIDGNGDAKIKITNMRIIVTQNMKLVTDESGVHRIKLEDSYSYDVDYQGNVHFQLANLFKNNAEISQAILNFLNENWKLIVGEFGKPILDYFMNNSHEAVQKFYEKVPYEEIIGIPFDEALKAQRKI